MENIIRQMMIDSVKETIKTDNIICAVCKRIFKSVHEEATKDKKVSLNKIQDLLAIQNIFLTAHEKELTSENFSKEQIAERIAILDILREMTKSLFDDAFNNLNKRLNELKDESQNKRKDELNELTKDELIDLVKTLEKEKEQK